MQAGQKAKKGYEKKMKIGKYFVALSAIVLSLTLFLYPVYTASEPTVPSVTTTTSSGEGGHAAFLDWQDDIEEDASATVNQETEVFATLPEAIKSEIDASDSVEDVDAE